MDRPANDGEFKWNLSANEFPPLPVVVPIPVIIPENPFTFAADIPDIFSYIGSGSGTITFGGYREVYPRRGW